MTNITHKHNTRKRSRQQLNDDNDNNNDNDNDNDDNKNKQSSTSITNKNPITISNLSVISINSINQSKRHKTNQLNPLLNSLSAKDIESAFLLVTNLTVERAMMFAILDEVYRSFPLDVLQELQYTSEAEHGEVEIRIFKIKKEDIRLKKAHERWQNGLNTLLNHPHYHRRYVFFYIESD